MPKMYKMLRVCAGYAPSFSPSVSCGVTLGIVEWEARPGEPEPVAITHGICAQCHAKQLEEINIMEESKL